jgi:sec-independent protein translocase protein TatB
MVVIAVVALVILGPQRLPEVLKQVGRFYVQIRRTSSDFKGAFDQVVRQAEDEIRLQEIKRLTALVDKEANALNQAIQSESHPSVPVGAHPQGRSNELHSGFDVAASEDASARFHESGELKSHEYVDSSPSQQNPPRG